MKDDPAKDDVGERASEREGVCWKCKAAKVELKRTYGWLVCRECRKEIMGQVDGLIRRM